MRTAVIARRLMLAIAILSVAGALISSVSLYHHYGTETTTYCDFGQTFNCDVVNRSAYSSIEGIPVALIGILGYVFLLALSTLRRSRLETPIYLLAASLGGLAFALYLTYVEKFILSTWCILCLSSLAAITGIALSAIILNLQTRRL